MYKICVQIEICKLHKQTRIKIAVWTHKQLKYKEFMLCEHGVVVSRDTMKV